MSQSPSSLPYFPFWARDYLAAESRATLDLDTQGAYVALLCYAWLEDGLLCTSVGLRRLAGADPRVWPRIWRQLEPLFPIAADGRRRNPRQEQERAKALRIKTIRSRGGKARASAGRGQNGLFVQHPLQQGDQQASSKDASKDTSTPSSKATSTSTCSDTSSAPRITRSQKDQEQDQDPDAAGAASDHLPVETVEISPDGLIRPKVGDVIPIAGGTIRGGERSAKARRLAALVHIPPMVFQAFVRDLRQQYDGVDEASFKEAVKIECAQRGWHYDAHIISAALRREDAKRLREEGALS